MSLSIAIVCESPVDRVTGSHIIDRKILKPAQWIDSSNVRDYFAYRGFNENESELLWISVANLAKENNVKVRGFFGNSMPPSSESHNAYKALLLLALKSDRRPDAIILLRDSDDQVQIRSESLEYARNAFAKRLIPVLVGLPITKRECWVISGFQPNDDAESKLLEDLRKEISFDPLAQSEQLTAKNEYSTNSAKRVYFALIRDSIDREQECLNAPYDILHARGANNGLSAFLNEIDEYLLPLFTPTNAK
jgi:hypothetical protein